MHPSVNPDGGSGPEEPPRGAAQPLLYATGVTKEFGGLVAVNDVSFDITPGSIVSIIGPNGAGKTTFFNMLTGLYRPTSGRIYFDGRDVTRARPDKITAGGVARTFQNIRLFGAMTALENVMVGRHARMKTGLIGSIGRPPWVRREERDVRQAAADMLSYVGLQSSPLRQPRDQSLLRRPAPSRDRPGTRLRAEAAAARRADRRHEPAGVRPSHRIHAHDAQGPVAHDPPDRARHEGDHGRLRADHRA